MYDNYNYPMGSDTPSAPWNEVEMPDIEVTCTVAVHIGKQMKVYNNQYTVDCDDNGQPYNTEFLGTCRDLEDDVNEQHYDIPALMAELAKYIKREIAGGGISPARYHELDAMLDDCEGWEVEEMEVTDYEL